MFIHRFAPAGTELCGERHATVESAHECEEWTMAAAWDAEQVYCSLCDGIGHGQPGYGGCPLENRGVEDTYAEEAWEAARGVVSFEEAFAAAMA